MSDTEDDAGDGSDWFDTGINILIAGVVAYFVYTMLLEPMIGIGFGTLLLYGGGAILLALLLRGVWIVKKSGDARIERKKAAVKAREGRDPTAARTYEQDIEAQAIEHIAKVPLLRRVVEPLREEK